MEGNGSEEAGSSGGHTIFVRNLAFSVTDEALEAFFGRLGAVKRASIARVRRKKIMFCGGEDILTVLLLPRLRGPGSKEWRFSRLWLC